MVKKPARELLEADLTRMMDECMEEELDGIENETGVELEAEAGTTEESVDEGYVKVEAEESNKKVSKKKKSKGDKAASGVEKTIKKRAKKPKAPKTPKEPKGPSVPKNSVKKQRTRKPKRYFKNFSDEQLLNLCKVYHYKWSCVTDRGHKLLKKLSGMNERMNKIYRELELREKTPDLDLSLMIKIPAVSNNETEAASSNSHDNAQLPDLVIG